ncbi:MAG TPA: SDR family NAD(P)-dependent oxidoreductase [Nitrospiraceae bacterium]|jgi:NAD(P)-dependent dehydrogenase (short-subunit alcohol dehydrogenase family)|nr:SDR family NAD(P)-dependent oxidoreductase [Nitrospiraceae bacterium]
MRVAGKVAIVTGANVGIGAAVAKVLAEEGAVVVITGRRKDLLDQVVLDIQRKKGRALAVAGSVTDESHVRSVVDQCVRTFGALHILVNNAGIGAFGKLLHEIDDATWHEMLDVNLTGVFRMTRAAVPVMLKHGGGSIINMSSVGGVIGFSGSAAYGTSKGGLELFTKCVAMDYAQDGIRCNSVCPGLIDTPMAAPLLNNPDMKAEVLATYPIRRVGTPEEVAKMVLYLASDDASWVTGSSFMIDGGLTAH